MPQPSLKQPVSAANGIHCATTMTCGKTCAVNNLESPHWNWNQPLIQSKNCTFSVISSYAVSAHWQINPCRAFDPFPMSFQCPVFRNWCRQRNFLALDVSQPLLDEMNGDLDSSVGSSTVVSYKIDSITLMVYRLACCKLMSDSPNVCTVRHGGKYQSNHNVWQYNFIPLPNMDTHKDRTSAS